MIRHHNPLNPDLHRPPRIRHALDPLQHNRPVPMRLQEPNLLPRVAPPREDHMCPLRRRDTHILLDVHPMPLPKPPSEHRIRKPQLDADLVCPQKRVIPIIQIRRPPAEDQTRRNLIVLAQRPVKLVPARPVAARRRYILDTRRRGRAQDIRDVLRACSLRGRDLPVAVEDALDADGRHGDGVVIFVAEHCGFQGGEVGADEA
ncbi:hypothetical protein GB937_009949 [Aspergillus fischeri]|nr:hypothetical protein GB937_009949 [Aspergillus fischeri]